MERTKHTRHLVRLCLLMLGATLALLPLRMAGATQIDDGVSSDSAGEVGRIGMVELRVETSGAVTTASLAAEYEPFLLDVQSSLPTIVDATPESLLVIRFASALPDTEPDGWTTVADSVAVNGDATIAVIDVNAFLALADTDAKNQLRHLIAQRWLIDASGGEMPTPLVDGFARYLETPVLAQQARQASLAQQAYLNGELPSWDEIATSPGATRALDPKAAQAARMAVAAFLVERYGANVIAELSMHFAGEAEGGPIEAIMSVTGQPEDQLDAGWEDFIAAWFAGGWRNNAFAALDLQPARDLFARGAYEAAVDRANQTLQVTTSLDDRVASAEAEMVVAQGSVGMQAEALMTDAEAALQEYDYSRAMTLIDRAEAQYARLPEDHRPTSLIESWRGIADEGLGAIEDLNDATASFDDWFSLRSARQDAVDAGTTFASLGDEDQLAIAQQLVDDLDARFLRLVLALGSAILILAGWLLVWSWHRSPGRMRWPGFTDLAQQEGAR